MSSEQHTPFPVEQRKNLVEELHQRLLREQEDESVPFDRAYRDVALDLLGFDDVQGAISDGTGDCGVDFWLVEEKSATICQFKSRDYVAFLDDEAVAGPDYLGDLPRIRSLLSNLDKPPKEANSSVKEFVKELKSAVQRFFLRDQKEDSAFPISIYYCCLAKSFSLQAAEEFESFTSSTVIEWGTKRIELTVIPVFIDDLLAQRWRETNTDWRDSSGKKNDTIKLTICGEVIGSAKSLVFFTKAHDLVEAFDSFGYQIFEPNVRCELKRSRVNEAIRESIKTSRGRREFKHLNNGITLISAGFTKPKGEGHSLSVRQPGVINGLQTIKSIHDAYDELSEKERTEFIENCEILVRLHTRDAVGEYRDLVKSTNNQNPMQPRNLRSNDPEQLQYEAMFANLNWFYERKEGAWKAFSSDSSLWGSLKGKKVSDFKSQRTGLVRNIDNLEMSQAWLSLIGFSNEAIHNKRDIFTEERYYDLVFKLRTAKHGYDYDFSISDAAVKADAEAQAPSAKMFLLAHLCREIADTLTPSRKQHRDECIKRLKIGNQKKEDQDAKLMADAKYVRGLVLAGAKYLFGEFVGLCLFRALGPQFHEVGPKILASPSLKPIASDRDFEHLQRCLETDSFKDGDVIAILWALYVSCIENIVDMPGWRQQFELAAVRSRFNYSEFNRKKIYEHLESLDKVYQKRPFPSPWSQGFETSKGIFKYVGDCLR